MRPRIDCDSGLGPRLRRACGATVLGLVLACGCGNDTLAPFQPEVSNLPDNFQLQATQVRNVSTTVTYPWTNTGVTANVNQASTVTSGSATLRIRDAAGGEVYSRSLADNGTFVTAIGTSGGWTIDLALSNYSGTLNFRAQKP